MQVSSSGEKVWSGFGVKRPGQTLPGRIDDLTLAYGLFEDCFLPVYTV